MTRIILNVLYSNACLIVMGDVKILYEFNKEKKVNNKEIRSWKSVCLFVCLSSGSLASGPSSYEVASPASQELYVFDANGTHQFTMSLVTGDYKYNFSYRLVCGNEQNCFEKKKLCHNFAVKMSAFVAHCKTVYMAVRNYLVCALFSSFVRT